MTKARQRRRNSNPGTDSNGGSVATDYRAELWSMADALRGSMDAAEYKHVVLGLVFLKYISDAFEEAHAKLEAERDEGADPEDPDEYRGQSIFWVPPEARWPKLQAQARQPTIGQAVDDAMSAIERDNPALKEALPKEYARPALDKNRLGQVVDLVSNIKVGGADARATDVLGNVYEYFLEQFALAEGRKGGEFYTPRSVVRLLAEMLEPYQGRVYDPCCGSAGMFVQSVEFIRAHASGNGNGGKARGDISIYGQESNYTTWRMARMNLAIRGIEGRIEHGDSFHNDRHPDLRADYILANPPFITSRTGAATGCVTTGAGSTARRRSATPTMPGCSTSSTTWRRAAWRDLCWRTVRCRRASRTRVRYAKGSSRRTWWTVSWRCRASCSARRRYRPACGFWRAAAATGNSGRGGARSCSSTRASWATWSTGRTGTCRRRRSRAWRRPITRGAARVGWTRTRTCPDSARARGWRRSANMGMC